jgi:hypothetical protein
LLFLVPQIYFANYYFLMITNVVPRQHGSILILWRSDVSQLKTNSWQKVHETPSQPMVGHGDTYLSSQLSREAEIEGVLFEVSSGIK